MSVDDENREMIKARGRKLSEKIPCRASVTKTSFEKAALADGALPRMHKSVIETITS